MMRKRAVLFAVIAFLIGHISVIMQDIIIGLLTAAAVMIVILVAVVRGKVSTRQSLLLLVLFFIGVTQRYIVDLNNVTGLASLQAQVAQQSTRQTTHFNAMNDKTDNNKLEASARGSVISEVEIDGNVVAFTFQTKELVVAEQLFQLKKAEKFMVRILLQEQEELEQARLWRRGSSIDLQGTIEAPPEANNRGMFNYRSYLQKKGIHWLWRSKGSHQLQLIDEQKHLSSELLHHIDKLRYMMAAPLDYLYSEVESGYLKGLILGIRADLDPDQFRSFSTLGLTHILAISGLHVAVFMYMMTACFKAMRISKEHIITLLLIAIPCYVALTGASPSVLRAGLMAMLGLLAAKSGTLKDGLHIIAVVAALLVLWRPYLIHDVSFQLSFIVTLGLIVGVPAIQRIIPSQNRWKWLIDLLSVTIVAQIISFPLSIYYFNQLHLLSLAANLILVPFISMIVMPLASLSLLLGHISMTLAKPFSLITHWCNEFSFAMVQFFSRANKLYTVWPSPSLFWILLWYCFWFYLFHYWRYKVIDKQTLEKARASEETEPLDAFDELEVIYPQHKDKRQSWWIAHRLKLGSVFAVVFMLLHGYNPNLLDSTAMISFLDVGQGDASLIRTPTGKNILIDGGGTVRFGADEDWKRRQDPFEIGKNVLLPILMKRGVQQLDVMIITHLDTDHIGGLLEVINTIPVKEIWWNGSYKSSQESDQLFQLIIDKAIPLRTPLIGEHYQVDRYTMIEIMWPLADKPSIITNAGEQNELSLVFLLTIYATTVLYTGDINSTTEDLLITNHYTRVSKGLSNPLPDIQVLKAAHHGSRYSTDYSWLSFVQPKATVISAGKNNVYGHPHPKVLDRLRQYNSLVWRTDMHGEVQLLVDKSQSYVVNWK